MKATKQRTPQQEIWVHNQLIHGLTLWIQKLNLRGKRKYREAISKAEGERAELYKSLEAWEAK